MGRQIKRVALDFAWPLQKVWKGFVNPYPPPPSCPDCDGSGHNAATLELSRLWYDHEGFGVRWAYDYGFAPDGTPAERPPWRILGDCRRWNNKLTQDEVDALAKSGRLFDFTHEWRDGPKGRRWYQKDPPYHPTAAEVNHREDYGGPLSGHDSINSWICLEVRAKRLGIWGKCDRCHGKGQLRLPRKMKKRYAGWRDYEPPSGPGWQVWETVSEGSPVSPVFASADDLIMWLVEHQNYSIQAAANFVLGTGWVPSMLMTDGPAGKHLLRDIEAAALMTKDGDGDEDRFDSSSHAEGQ